MADWPPDLSLKDELVAESLSVFVAFIEAILLLVVYGAVSAVVVMACAWLILHLLKDLRN